MNSDSAKSEEIKAEFPNSESISHQIDQEVNNSHSVENNVDAGNSAKSEEIKAEFSKSESVFHQVDQEVNNSNSGEINPDFADHKVESDPVIPNSELNSVIAFLKGNSAAENPESKIPNGGESGSILSDLPSADLELLGQKVDHNIQVQLKTEGERLLLILPTESQVSPSEFNWWEIWQQMKQRLNAGDRLRKPNTSLHLVAKDRLLDNRQLQDLAETLNTYQIQLKSVATSRRQTAIAACTLGYSVEQTQLHTSLTSDIQPTPSALADALYLQMTVRSGVEIRHPGTVVILGDINPSGIVIADGDILIWGRLRGVAHAGAGGNRESLIMALQMEPTQLRIADAVARSPEKTLTSFFPEVAHITSEGIRIVKAADFSRSQLSSRTQLVTQNLI
ncbi:MULTISPECIES: septum site-determining protein MinC [Nostocales]|uniref:septum site-determining protein MinC n=1 Tax=Nostocales TaxID=1161 RepID=UPI00029B581D|nr:MULTISPECIES: septum site-determining protein MinC [Nostocales]AFW94434.1 septum formation inhibitor protein MinC [Anabaena sp. 90]MTJ19486.1 septum site-determining protein MinC [Dolichospermum sp. UHCC 0299]MTJ23256.1 septum site-determining protein MinC [Dolichospermum sp. UHCC 0352]